MKKEVRVFAPASVSNVACGFDIMGFAIEKPGDEVVLRLAEKPGVRITKITGDQGKLPLDPEVNTAGAPVIALREYASFKGGIEIEIHKKMALGSGLGSSAASAVAAAFAADRLLGLELSKSQLLDFAIIGEKIASGAVHADNVAPSLYGGFILIRGYNPPDIVEIPVPEGLFCTVIHPHTEINTRESRKLLPALVTLEDAKTQWGNTAGLIAGLMKPDFGLIARSLQDVIIEPARKSTIPCYEKIKQASLEAGALGCNISGSGPSIFALSDSLSTARLVGEKMRLALDGNIGSEVYVSAINRRGPYVIEEK
ncbi:MAG: homoserine kinase [Ignavibacteria bacterium]|jgi:homoserine kinase|nr:homoserine kinase [Ignavibacteria bacterium]MCU7502161.1 homoserine kinase [Ignavibacteria bacterium]MCU7515563.1 homoserine kinase [Ignavibacteria bacterium]